MTVKVRLAILEDHQSIIDGYCFRLQSTEEVQVVATANFAVDLEPMLAKESPTMLLMDVHVPVSPENPNPYPILQIIPTIKKSYPALTMLAISAHNRPELVNAVIKAGAKGYIYKNDHGTIQNLGHVILAVAKGLHFISKAATLSESAALVPKLTPRQLEILSIFASEPDLTAITVARRLNISHSTLRNQLSKGYERLGVQNLTAAIDKMREHGILVYPETSLEDLFM